MLKTLLAAALVSAQAAAVPVPSRCITRGEVGDLTLVGTAIAIEVVRNACRTHLPETAFLATPAGAEFSARLRAEGQRRLDSAMAGIARLSSDSNMSSAAVETFIRAMMTEGAGADFARVADASLCRDANEIMEIASTLSPDQMARFVAAFASIGDHFARMQPPPGAHRPTPPEAAPPALRPAPPETAPPTPHPASLEVPRRHAPPPVVAVPATRPPGARTAPRPPMRPFLCPQPE